MGKYARNSERKFLEVAIKNCPQLAGSLFKYENMGESGYSSREIAEAVWKLEKIHLYLLEKWKKLVEEYVKK